MSFVSCEGASNDFMILQAQQIVTINVHKQEPLSVLQLAAPVVFKNLWKKKDFFYAQPEYMAICYWSGNKLRNW